MPFPKGLEAAPARDLADGHPETFVSRRTNRNDASWADTDGEALIFAARDGDPDAIDALYRKHREQALRFAWTLAGNSYDAEDMLHTAFTKTINALANGRGPQGCFPAYLNTAIKSVALGIWTSSHRELPLEPQDLETARKSSQPSQPDIAGRHEHVLTALQTLPRRWQTVLWYAEVLQEPPRRIGPLMGITPNAASALLVRATAGLRTAFLQAHQTHS